VTKKIFFKSGDGTSLCGVWQEPEIKTNKAIILVHGITANKDESGIFIELSESLKSKGYAVFRFDFRGSGESEGKSVDITIKKEKDDLSAAFSIVENAGYKKIGLLGASFGGGITALWSAINQDKILALCLWNPVLNYDHCFLNPVTDWLKNRNQKIFSDFKKQGWSTLGSQNFVIGKNLFDEMAMLFPYQELKKIKKPILIIHGDQDGKVPVEDSQEYAKDVGNFILIKGSDHGFHESPYDKQAIILTLEFFFKNL